MARSRIDEALAALAAKGDDGFAARREVLERAASDMLQRPALGGQIVARLCAVAEPTPKDADLLDLLGAGLEAARMACENGKARGQTLIDTVEEALDLARRKGRMTAGHTLLLAQLWSRAGLRPFSNVSRSGTNAAMAPAVTGPIPGMVQRRRS